ncbi:helix-turn-helix domain-containing protein [Ktedonospora formicarum]|uniref:HTH araC/xylS-type domain-containing protein n=1 Tax=Ktedonospora formicarum TaxID=2778364 RepID=A0A8J3MY54_9CHLR|nr:hypothetical protein KSX_74580 [Ktedonospora formicarum]
MGLTPRQFYRVHRFNEVLRLLESDSLVHWADIALTCGYYDQAHLIHDFQAFVGLAPGEYLSQRSIYSHHIPFSD